MTTTLNSEKGRPSSGVSDMKAVLARAHGGPEVLTLEDVDRPKPEANQVLVEVHAAATNRSDWHRRWGCAQ
jgi:NADPH:quinone reductase-like Zn-dependent oxidoreductase